MTEYQYSRNNEVPGFLRYHPVLSEETQIEAVNCVKSAHQAIIDIDTTILRYALALEAAQPVAPGKISIRFLRLTGRNQGSRTPVFIQWFRSARSNRWLYKQLDSSKVLLYLKGYAAFRMSRDDAKQVLIEARKLMEIRQSLSAEVGHLRRRLGNHVAQSTAAAAAYAAKVDEWLPRLEKQRAEIIAANLEGERLAKSLPEGMYVDSETMPRVSPHGSTRGIVEPTRQRKRSTG